jgi:hypothetical protein
MSAGVFEPAKQTEVMVYPNPVKDQLTVQFGADINSIASISIFDMTGRLVYSGEKEIAGNKLTVRLPETSVSKGLHLMQIDTGKSIFSSKFMIY